MSKNVRDLLRVSNGEGSPYKAAFQEKEEKKNS